MFGAAPNAVDEPEKILLRVASWAWISRPMTVSHSITSYSVPARAACQSVQPAGIGARPTKQQRLAEMRADQLQPDRQVATADEAARDGDARQAGEVAPIV